MTIDQFPGNHVAAAAFAGIFATLAVFAFLRAWLDTLTLPPHDNHSQATTAVCTAALSATSFVLAGAPLMFINPIISGFLDLVALAVFGYTAVIESMGVPPQHRRPAPVHDGEPAELGHDLHRLDQQTLWWAPNSRLIRDYHQAAEFHRRRNQGPR